MMMNMQVEAHRSRGHPTLGRSLGLAVAQQAEGVAASVGVLKAVGIAYREAQ